MSTAPATSGTYWSGFRGDRAMVRRPAIEGPVPTGVTD